MKKISEWLKVLCAVFLCLPGTANAQFDPRTAWQSPEWDWFGYQWDAEYGGNVMDDFGNTVGRVWWIDYNQIVSIGLVSLPVNLLDYNRLKGFKGPNYDWVGKLYNDYQPIFVNMRWQLVPNGATARIDFYYQENEATPVLHWWGILTRRW
jgi:hypothetical protein